MPSDDLPNLALVSPGIYRGGQPTKAGWKRLKDLGVTNVVKLNLASELVKGEAQDTVGEELGMRVQRFPLDVGDQLDPLEYNEANRIVNKAVGAIGPGTYVHCTHGEDRTGLVVFRYRLKHGWSKADAKKELMAHGFHRELLGLWSLVEGSD